MNSVAIAKRARKVSVTFLEHNARPQVPVAGAAFYQWVAPDGSLWTLFYRQGRDYLLRFPGLADFEVSADGCQVAAWAAPGGTSATVQHLYLNQVLPLALSRQGKLVLHASAVELADRAVAFIGESGRGKSTLAASFATGGVPFLTDDGLHLEWAGDELTVHPSHPSIRLWADSQEALVRVGAAAAPALDFTTKTRLLASPALPFCDQARPLGRVYFLGDGLARSATIERAKPAVTLINLIRNSFLLDITQQEMLAHHFEHISRIANLPIHYHLDYPRRYEDLALVREAIIRHSASGEAK